MPLLPKTLTIEMPAEAFADVGVGPSAGTVAPPSGFICPRVAAPRTGSLVFSILTTLWYLKPCAGPRSPRTWTDTGVTPGAPAWSRGHMALRFGPTRVSAVAADVDAFSKGAG